MNIPDKRGEFSTAANLLNVLKCNHLYQFHHELH